MRYLVHSVASDTERILRVTAGARGAYAGFGLAAVYSSVASTALCMCLWLCRLQGSRKLLVGMPKACERDEVRRPTP